MKDKIMNKTGNLFSRTGLKIKKHSPEILMVAGIAGTVASTIMACKATTKVNDILEPVKSTIDIVHEGMEKGEIRGVEYSKEDGKKDLTIIYIQTGVKLVRLYAPAITLGALSITSIVAGHNILKKRNIAIAAAYAAVDKGFKDYRKRVVERFGDELDRELRYNIKKEEIETEVTDENGNKTVKKETVSTIDSNPLAEYSDYARFFDETSDQYHKDAEYNLMYIRRQQDWANEKLKSQGYLFLNDVYEALGIQKTKAGHVVGWIYDPKDEKRDNYVDFGIYSYSEDKRRFVNGYEKAILLDFNVDGIIYDQI